MTHTLACGLRIGDHTRQGRCRNEAPEKCDEHRSLGEKCLRDDWLHLLGGLPISEARPRRFRRGTRSQRFFSQASHTALALPRTEPDEILVRILTAQGSGNYQQISQE